MASKPRLRVSKKMRRLIGIKQGTDLQRLQEKMTVTARDTARALLREMTDAEIVAFIAWVNDWPGGSEFQGREVSEIRAMPDTMTELRDAVGLGGLLSEFRKEHPRRAA